jgi:hypothetical protein
VRYVVPQEPSEYIYILVRCPCVATTYKIFNKMLVQHDYIKTSTIYILLKSLNPYNSNTALPKILYVIIILFLFCFIESRYDSIGFGFAIFLCLLIFKILSKTILLKTSLIMVCHTNMYAP